MPILPTLYISKKYSNRYVRVCAVDVSVRACMYACFRVLT